MHVVFLERLAMSNTCQEDIEKYWHKIKNGLKGKNSQFWSTLYSGIISGIINDVDINDCVRSIDLFDSIEKKLVKLGKT